MKNTPNTAHGVKIASALAFCFTTLAHAQEVPAHHVPPTNWNDTFVGVRYSDNFYFPGSANKVAQKIGFVTTAGGFKYGNYVFNADYLISDKNNPEANGPSGAQEIYSIGKVEWSGARLTGQAMDFGFIRDIGLSTGFEFSSKNDAFGSRARMLVLGPTLEFAVPRGFWNFTAGLRTETNHNGIVHQDVKYDTAWHLESVWQIPFNAGPAPLVFKGFAAATGPKGKDGFHADTKTEVLTRTSLLLDVGALADAPRTVYIGPGYEYWHNMFGSSSPTPGTKRSAAVLVGEIHF